MYRAERRACRGKRQAVFPPPKALPARWGCNTAWEWGGGLYGLCGQGIPGLWWVGDEAARAEPAMKARKERLDLLLVERGHAPSRAQAQALIRSGRVRADGALLDKPGAQVSTNAVIELSAPPRYVSRGGEKLEAALAAFTLDPRGKICLDVGSSTGGFTDCLLQHGAQRVHAVDVGRGQLDWKLRNDPRVIVHEGLNARYLQPEDVGELVDLATVDVSFISLRLVLPPLAAIVRPGGKVIALVKPQFEAGRERVRRGVVRDPAVHHAVVDDVVTFARESLGWTVHATAPSPLLGPAGNREFFVCFAVQPDPRQQETVSRAPLAG